MVVAKKWQVVVPPHLKPFRHHCAFACVFPCAGRRSAFPLLDFPSSWCGWKPQSRPPAERWLGSCSRPNSQGSERQERQGVAGGEKGGGCAGVCRCFSTKVGGMFSCSVAWRDGKSQAEVAGGMPVRWNAHAQAKMSRHDWNAGCGRLGTEWDCLAAYLAVPSSP